MCAFGVIPLGRETHNKTLPENPGTILVCVCVFFFGGVLVPNTNRLFKSAWLIDQTSKGRSFLLTARSFLLRVGLCCLRSIVLVSFTYG